MLFSEVPVNLNARRRFMRAARLGTRPVPVVPNYGDAARTVDTVRAVQDGWQSSSEELAVVVRAAWAAR